MFKHFLSIFLMVLGLGLTSSLTAQSHLSQDGLVTNPKEATVQVNEAVASQNLLLEVVSLKSSLQSLTPGSTDYVDAVRRVETFGRAMQTLDAGESVTAAYNTAINYLYNGIDVKEAELASLVQIEQTLHDLTNN